MLSELGKYEKQHFRTYVSTGLFLFEKLLNLLGLFKHVQTQGAHPAFAGFTPQMPTKLAEERETVSSLQAVFLQLIPQHAFRYPQTFRGFGLVILSFFHCFDDQFLFQFIHRFAQNAGTFLFGFVRCNN